MHFIFCKGKKYEPVLLDNAYKVHMKLTIRSVGASDFGTYKCVSKNSLGETDGSIKLYREYWIPHMYVLDYEYLSVTNFVYN